MEGEGGGGCESVNEMPSTKKELTLFLFLYSFAFLWKVFPDPKRWISWRCGSDLSLNGSAFFFKYIFLHNLLDFWIQIQPVILSRTHNPGVNPYSCCLNPIMTYVTIIAAFTSRRSRSPAGPTATNGPPGNPARICFETALATWC